MRDIHISIVSHGHTDYVTRLLADLSQMPSSQRYQVTLVINIPEAGVGHPAQARFPVSIIRNSSPQGFGKNHNLAFHRPPFAGERAFFVVLNPDVELRGDVLAALADQLGRIENPGVIAPTVLSPQGVREDSARELPSVGGLLKKLFGRTGAWHVPHPDRMFAPDWVAGMCMVFPQQVFAQIGGFDERYFLYYEDVDICSRLWLAGYSVLVDPAQSIVHDAQRASRRRWEHARWHLRSIIRFFASGVCHRVRLLHRKRQR